MSNGTAKLAKSLSEAARLLRDVDATFWSKQLERVATRGEKLDAGDLAKIVGWFGGMGSMQKPRGFSAKRMLEPA